MVVFRRRFIGHTHFCTTNYFFGQESYIHFVAKETSIIRKKIHKKGRNQRPKFDNQKSISIIISLFINNYNKNTTFDFNLFDEKKIKNEQFSDNPGFLGYKVSIRFLTEKYYILKFVAQKWVGPKKRQIISISSYNDVFVVY